MRVDWRDFWTFRLNRSDLSKLDAEASALLTNDFHCRALSEGSAMSNVK